MSCMSDLDIEYQNLLATLNMPNVWYLPEEFAGIINVATSRGVKVSPELMRLVPSAEDWRSNPDLTPAERHFARLKEN